MDVATRPSIRVASFAGPSARPTIESVPWPEIPVHAALIQIGACGVCGTDQHILRGTGQSLCRGRSRSGMR
jgi:D-arabinose 1-dehydrogenase-like Zn-dependent alcohol dehydrogenase